MSLALPSSLTWRDLAVKTYHEVVDDDVLGMAAQLSYYFFLALFPAILFGLALASFFPLQSLTDDLSRVLGPVVSPEVLKLIQDQMQRLGNAESGGLLTFGVLGALWSSSAALVSIVDALNRAYDIEESRPWWKVRLVAMGLTIGLAVFILVALTLVLAGPSHRHLPRRTAGHGLGPEMDLADSSVARRARPRRAGARRRVLFRPGRGAGLGVDHAGRPVGSVLWLLVSLATKVYVANFTDYNAAYGSVGGVMVVMLWMYVSSIAILVAAELNAEIEHASPHGKKPGQKTPEGRRVLGPRAARLAEERPQAEPETPAPAPWPPAPPSEPAHGPALGAVAAAVILGVRAWNDARAKDARDDRTDAPPQVG